MSTTQTWVICEQSGRWAAALRLAIARLPRVHFAPRLYEVRNLTDLLAFSKEQRGDLALIEVGRQNLAEVLELLAEGRSLRPKRSTALLDHSDFRRDPVLARTQSVGRQAVIDALWEAGASDVIESPRHLDRLLAIGEQLAKAPRLSPDYSREDQSIADWAWSCLPWQNEM